MTLDDIFNQLSYGELVQIYAGSGDSGLTEAKDRLKIAASISLGLTELHKRFLIREGEEQVQLTSTQLTYSLTNSDVIRIERVYDAEGNELNINIVDDPESIRTPTMTSLKVPSTLSTEYLTVVYRAKHPELDKSKIPLAPDEIEVELPEAYLVALLYFVASRVLNPIGIADNFHEGNNYTAKFEAACQLLGAENIEVATFGENNRFVNNGWA